MNKKDKYIRRYNVNLNDKLILTKSKIIVKKGLISKKYNRNKVKINYQGNIIYLNNDGYKFNSKIDLLSFKTNVNDINIGSIILASVIGTVFIYNRINDTYHLYKKVRDKFEK